MIHGQFFDLKDKEQILNSVFTKRNPNTNKGDYGRVAIVAGSPGMCGAASLCAESALKSGAGLVYNFVPADLIPIIESTLRESVKIDIQRIDEFISQTDVIAVGPGLGRSRETQDFVVSLFEKFADYEGKIILDADGINAFAGKKKLLADLLKKNELGRRTIITPHPGELSRLIEKSIKDIQSDRTETALETAEDLGCTVLLKGHHTVTATTDGRYTENGSGNPGMATAGTGDVLTGIISAFAVNMDVYNAGRYGAFYHGLLGDRAADKYGEYSMIAGDLLK